MKKIVLIYLLGLFSSFTSAQDLIFTVSGQYMEEYIPIDSILVENLSNGTRIFFSDLPENIYYQINLTQLQLLNTSDLLTSNKSSEFIVVKNVPGKLSLLYKGKIPADIIFSVYRINGQKIYTTEQKLFSNNIINLDIRGIELFIIKAETSDKVQSFKVIGSLNAGNSHVNIDDSHNAQRLIPSSLVFKEDDFTFKVGDNIRISVFKRGYYAEPVEFVILNSQSFIFQFIKINNDEFDIVLDGDSKATIVIPNNYDEPALKDWTYMAAEWLRDYILESTGTVLRIIPESMSVKGNIISVGKTNLSETAGISVEGLKWDGCRMVVKDNILYLLGFDELGPKGKEEKGSKGTCKAVTAFLEDFVGVRWFIPSPMGEMVPKNEDITVPNDLDTTIQPKMRYSEGGRFFDAGTPGSFANNNHTAVKVYGSAHTWKNFVPADKYFDEHPEYFAMRDGERTAGNGHGNYLCTSNPEVRNIIIKEIRKKFDEGYDWVALGQADGFKRCMCPQCESLDNFRGIQSQPRDCYMEPDHRELIERVLTSSQQRAQKSRCGKDKYYFEELPENPVERLHLLNKAVIDSCRKSHPNKKILLLTYSISMWPSRKFDEYGDNVISNICQFYPYTFPVWKPKVGGINAYVYWWGNWNATGIGPSVTPKQVAEAIRFMDKYDVTGINYCGGIGNWGLEGISNYAVGRLINDPECDPKEIIEEYCNFVYGKAGSTMIDFFNILYERIEKFELGIFTSSTSFNETDSERRCHVRDYPESLYPRFLPPWIIQQLDYLIEKAELEADCERSRGWMKLTRDCYDLERAKAEMYTSYSVYKDDPNQTALLKVKADVDKYKEIRDKIIAYGSDKEYISTWFPGWNKIKKHFDSGGSTWSTIGPPVNLNFDELIN